MWGSIAGYLKAKRGVHEVITTIMLNWTALYLSNYIVKTFLSDPGQQRSRQVHESALLHFPGLQEMFAHARVHFGILFGLLCAWLFYVMLWKTRRGFELRAVGYSWGASEYAGMNVSKNIIQSMWISGIFAGLGGATETLGVFGYQLQYQSSPQYGFDGIAVALIGGNAALGVILGAVLLGVLKFGATGMKFGAGVPVEIINIIIALVIFFVAASGMVKGAIRFFKKRRNNRPAVQTAEDRMDKAEGGS